MKVCDTLYDAADDIIKTVLLAFSTHGPTIEMIPMQNKQQALIIVVFSQ